MLLRIIVLLTSLTLPVTLLAGANTGKFMGYRLGDKYPLTATTEKRTTTNGNLSVIADEPFKPDNIMDVTLVVTPVSATIGFINASSWFQTEAGAREFGRQYIELLRAKYPEWTFGRERMNADMKIDEVNLDKAPFNLQMRLTSGKHNGQQGWRLSMTLRWLEGTKELAAWNNISLSEQNYRQEKERRELLEKSDIRGL